LFPVLLTSCDRERASYPDRQSKRPAARGVRMLSAALGVVRRPV